MRVTIGLAGLLLLAACGGAPAPETKQAVRLPEKTCSDAREGLAALEANATLDQDGAGSATIFQEAWLQIPAGQRETIANSLAVVAACAAPEPVAEQEVTITSETGTVLMRRTVELAVDPAAMFEE